MKIPLILLGKLTHTLASYDVLGEYMQRAIDDAMQDQYHEELILTDASNVIVGSIGGAYAFKHLPHRSLKDNATRYNITIPGIFECDTCKHKKLALCHRIPRSYGGNLSPHNLYADCSHCNSLQRNILTPAQILALLPYSLDIDMSAKTITAFINEVTKHE